jgi:benzoyl-CoA reductase/2-hydroxyglutaryl-CoA dehydratase subunit BcrC/BadD/HgdB
MIQLPENFEHLADAQKAGFLRLKALKDTGAKVVGTYCTFVPLELIYAAGAIPVSLCSSSENPIPAAEKHLPRNLCPLIKGSYGAALTDTCPYFYFSDLIVGETTCDGKRKMFELMNDIKETYVIQLPPTRDGDRAFQYMRGEFVAFKEKLEDYFHVTITEDDIRAAIKKVNHLRTVTMKYLQLGQLIPAPMSGYEMGSRVDAGGFSFDLDERIRTLEERTTEAYADWEANKKGKETGHPRLLVTGCPNAGVRDKIIKEVEDMGADVVVYDTCNGIRNHTDLVDETIDVYDALTRKYLDINCSVMSPNTKRLDYMGKLIDDFKVDGVLEIILQACHTYNVESEKVKRYVREEKGIGYLGIETDYSQSDKGQISTRLNAFLETLER